MLTGIGVTVTEQAHLQCLYPVVELLKRKSSSKHGKVAMETASSTGAVTHLLFVCFTLGHVKGREVMYQRELNSMRLLRQLLEDTEVEAYHVL